MGTSSFKTGLPRRIRRPNRRFAAVFAAGLLVSLCGSLVATGVVLAVGQSFGLLPTGFTQSLFASAQAPFGGVAPAPDGDLWVDECAFSGSPLHRFSSTQVSQQDGSTLHSETASDTSNAGCGLTTHPDGSLYSNASFGVANLDANTAALLRALGVPGNALGIAVDPQTNHLVYVTVDCRFTATCSLVDLDPITGNHHSLVSLNSVDAQFVDGIAFDPSGNFIFLANRAPQFRLTVLNRLGTLVRHVPLPSEPDGLAVNAGPPLYVVTNNTDGTLTRVDFPTGFSAAPTVSVFATGGFHGDLATVGQDGCLYVTQAGTRFDDGTTSKQSSLVRICGPTDFARQPGVPSPTPTVTPTQTVTPSVTPTVTPTATSTPTVTPSVTPTPTNVTVSTCNLYPIAVSAQALNGLAPGATLTYMVMGSAPGDYGWLTWLGSTDQTTLITSLTPPGDSHGAGSLGSFVKGRGAGIIPTTAMLAALNTLETLDITVPVWDVAQLQGTTPLYHVASFANVRLVGFNIPNQRISIRYDGPQSCT